MILRHRQILKTVYEDSTARDCVSIAASSIEAVSVQHASSHYKATDRYSSVVYLVNALLPLVCVIVNETNIRQTRTDAIVSFEKGLSILKGLSPNFSAARHTLRRLDRIIATVERTISNIRRTDDFTFDPEELDAATFLPNMAGLFNYDLWKDSNGDLIDKSLQGQVDFEYNVHDRGIVNCSGASNGTNGMWIDGDIMNSQIPLSFDR